jgi:hypothetical protein
MKSSLHFYSVNSKRIWNLHKEAITTAGHRLPLPYNLSSITDGYEYDIYHSYYNSVPFSFFGADILSSFTYLLPELKLLP